MRRVVFRPVAEQDLSELYAFIADTANRSVAAAYLDRVERAWLSLATFPERGRSRDDIHPGCARRSNARVRDRVLDRRHAR
jgi:toxin ParE1/3/4